MQKHNAHQCSASSLQQQQYQNANLLLMSSGNYDGLDITSFAQILIQTDDNKYRFATMQDFYSEKLINLNNFSIFSIILFLVSSYYNIHNLVDATKLL